MAAIVSNLVIRSIVTRIVNAIIVDGGGNVADVILVARIGITAANWHGRRSYHDRRTIG